MAGDKDDGEPPPCSVRASWQRRELADERGISLRCSLGQVASPGGFGGADRGRGALRPPVCRQKLYRRRCRLPGWLGALL